MKAGHSLWLRCCRLVLAQSTIAFACCLSLAGIGHAQTPGTFSPTGSMATPRLGQTATLLENGQVLIAGGTLSAGHAPGLTSAEIYDPASGQFASTGNLNQGRAIASAVRLLNGQVLVTGGESDAVFFTSAELYDPSSGTFVQTGSANATHFSAPVVLLNNGKVLFTGCAFPFASTAELYDPSSGTFALTAGGMITPRCGHSATSLPDGRVLIVGGVSASASGQVLTSAEIYDPVQDNFAPTGSLNLPRVAAAAAPLADGRVLISGGQNFFSTSAEVYDPATDLFSSTGNMITSRNNHSATLLPTGEVLLALGSDSFSFEATSAELYHPNLGEFFGTGSLSHHHGNGTATLLSNGAVLVVGGEDDSGTATAAAELYVPPPAWIPFSSIVAQAKVTVGTKKLGFNLNGSVTLGASSNGINPPGEVTYIALGSYTGVIPVGSFGYDAQHNRFVFSGNINNVSLVVQIIPQGKGVFLFEAQADGANLSADSNPLSVELHLGDDVGRTTISAQFIK